MKESRFGRVLRIVWPLMVVIALNVSTQYVYAFELNHRRLPWGFNGLTLLAGAVYGTYHIFRLYYKGLLDK